MSLIPLEAVVKTIMDDSIIMEISDTGQEIAWPLDAFKNEIATGDSFMICFKPTPAQSVKNILTAVNSQQNSANAKRVPDPVVLQKTLEALIN